MNAKEIQVTMWQCSECELIWDEEGKANDCCSDEFTDLEQDMEAG